MIPKREFSFGKLLIVVLLAIIVLLVILVVDLDQKSKQVITIKEPQDVILSETEQLENKINEYIRLQSPTALEKKYNISRKVEVVKISDDNYEVYVSYYQNGLRKLDFKSYFGEGDSSSLNVDNNSSSISNYLSKDAFSLRVFNDLMTDDEYYLIGDGDYKPDTDGYYIYDKSFNRLFQIPISNSGIFSKDSKPIQLVDIKENKIISYSYGKIVRDLDDEELYKYETYIENGKIHMNIIDKIKFDELKYENVSI